MVAMIWNTLIEHKFFFVIGEKSGPISLSYNVLLITLKVNIIVKPMVHVTTKSTSTYTNCGKIGHTFEICHNKKKKVWILPTITINSMEPIVKPKSQHIKQVRIHL
jgi:hypothetical protein